jgi:hypothetical protein
MKINEQLKGLENAMGDEFGKILPTLDPLTVSNFFTAASEIKRSVGEVSETKKKSKNNKKIKRPISKLPSFKEGFKRHNVNVKITEGQLKSLLREFTEVMVMCSPWSECMEDPYGENPKTRWFVGRLEYNDKVGKWYPYSQDSQSYKNREDATEAFFKGFYNKEPLYENKLKGGLSDNKTLKDIAKKHSKNSSYSIEEFILNLKKELKKGVKIEMEHTKDSKIATEIAMDHLFEDPNYYKKLKKIENNEAMGSGSAGGFSAPIGFDPKSDFVKRSFNETPKKIESNEATTSSSSGSYLTPAAWAKSTSKKHWRGKAKPQIPGGQFVQIKNKCKKFPYCNQGDIKALKLTNETILNKVIKNISIKEGISENVIKQILLNEYYNKIK